MTSSTSKIISYIANDCSDQAIIRGFHRLQNVTLSYNAGEAKNTLQLTLDPIMRDTKGDILFFGDNQEISGKSKDSLLKVLDSLDKRKTYILRTGTNGGGGHYQNIYYDGGWQRDNAGEVLPLTNESNEIQDNQAVDSILDKRSAWGKESRERSFVFYELNDQRLFTCANYIARLRKIESDHEMADTHHKLIKDSKDYFYTLNNYWQVDESTQLVEISEEEKETQYKELLWMQFSMEGEVILDTLLATIQINDTNEQGQTLIDIAIDKQDASSIKKLLSIENIILSQSQIESLNNATDSNIKKYYQIYRSRNNLLNNDHDELLLASQINNSEIIELLLQRTPATIEHIDELLNNNSSWSTIKDSLILLINNVINQNNATLIDEVFNKINQHKFANQAIPAKFLGCGLIKFTEEPTLDNTKSFQKDTVILFNDKLYYFDKYSPSITQYDGDKTIPGITENYTIANSDTALLIKQIFNKNHIAREYIERFIVQPEIQPDIVTSKSNTAPRIYYTPTLIQETWKKKAEIIAKAEEIIAKYKEGIEGISDEELATVCQANEFDEACGNGATSRFKLTK